MPMDESPVARDARPRIAETALSEKRAGFRDASCFFSDRLSGTARLPNVSPYCCSCEALAMIESERAVSRRALGRMGLGRTVVEFFAFGEQEGGGTPMVRVKRNSMDAGVARCAALWRGVQDRRTDRCRRTGTSGRACPLATNITPNFTAHVTTDFMTCFTTNRCRRGLIPRNPDEGGPGLRP
ncbi:hypothetical protein GCM10010388_70970 [Streptomyces mauvecolor]